MLDARSDAAVVGSELSAPEGVYRYLGWVQPAHNAFALSTSSPPSTGHGTASTGGPDADVSSNLSTSTSAASVAQSNPAHLATSLALGSAAQNSLESTPKAAPPPAKPNLGPGNLPTISNAGVAPQTTFSPMDPSARMSVVSVRYPGSKRDKEPREPKGGGGGPNLGTAGVSDTASDLGSGSNDGRATSAASWQANATPYHPFSHHQGEPIIEGALAAQGIDAPASHMTGGVGGIPPLATSWGWNVAGATPFLGAATAGNAKAAGVGGLGSAAATSAAAAGSAGGTSSSKAKPSRPKNSLKQTSSSFVQRLQSHGEINKLLSQRDDRDMFAFVNVGKNLFWLADTEGKVKEPLARISFSANITAHDVNQSNRSPDRLDVIVGFSTGDLIWLDVMSSRYTRINKGGCVTDRGVTQVRWLPGSDSLFLTSHADGTMLLWDKERDDAPAGSFHTASVPSVGPMAPVHVASTWPDAAGGEAMETLRSDLAEATGGPSPPSTGTTEGATDTARRQPTWDSRRYMIVTRPGEEAASAAAAVAGTAASAAPATASNGVGGAGSGGGGGGGGGGGANVGAGASGVGVGVGGGGGRRKDKEIPWARLNPVSHWKVSRGKINDFAFSPDFPHVAVVDEDGLLKIIDVNAERLDMTFESYFGALNCVAFSPDGRFLLTGGCDDLVTVWAPREARIVARCPGHTSFVTSVAFDPWRWRSDDARTYRFASVGEDCKVILWDFSGAALQRPKSHLAGGQAAAAARRSSMGSTLSLGLGGGAEGRRTSSGGSGSAFFAGGTGGGGGGGSGARRTSTGLDRPVGASAGGVGSSSTTHTGAHAGGGNHASSQNHAHHTHHHGASPPPPALVHAALRRDEVAQLQPLSVHQLVGGRAAVQSEGPAGGGAAVGTGGGNGGAGGGGAGVGGATAGAATAAAATTTVWDVLVDVRFRPQGMTVLRRGGCIDTLARPPKRGAGAGAAYGGRDGAPSASRKDDVRGSGRAVGGEEGRSMVTPSSYLAERRGSGVAAAAASVAAAGAGASTPLAVAATMDVSTNAASTPGAGTGTAPVTTTTTPTRRRYGLPSVVAGFARGRSASGGGAALATTTTTTTTSPASPGTSRTPPPPPPPVRLPSPAAPTSSLGTAAAQGGAQQAGGADAARLAA